MIVTKNIMTDTTTTKTRYRIEYWAVLFLIKALNILPLWFAMIVANIIGFLAFSVFKIRRKVTLDNLKKSFGDQYSDSEYIKIGARAYRNAGKGFIEYGLAPSFHKKNLSKYITIEGIDNLEYIAQNGKGAVLVTGHFGSWELMGAYIASNNWPIDYLVGEQHNLLVNDLMNSHRTIFGIGLIEMGVAARGVFKAVRNGRMVCMLSDQDAGNDGTVVNFLGRPASTPKGPAAFALKTGAPISCGFIIRKGNKHHIIIEKPIEFTPSGNKEDDIRALTQAYTDRIERRVREHPDHRFWPHRRWKSTT